MAAYSVLQPIRFTGWIEFRDAHKRTVSHPQARSGQFMCAAKPIAFGLKAAGPGLRFGDDTVTCVWRRGGVGAGRGSDVL